MIDPIILNKDILNYVEGLFPSLPPVLEKIDNQARQNKQPIVSKDAGMFLYLITKLVNPKRILEIGCNLGYSATWMGLAKNNNAIIDTIEIDHKIAEVANNNFSMVGLDDSIYIHVGAALDVIPTLFGTYDLVFIDAVKSEYKDYLELILPKLNKGALILVDNVLWSGAVAYDSDDRTTRALQDFNTYFMNHAQLESTILTIGDGLGFGIKV
ncbi:MAG: O-methyltransferase [Candidatus Sericytochromatia bacterium]